MNASRGFWTKQLRFIAGILIFGWLMYSGRHEMGIRFWSAAILFIVSIAGLVLSGLVEARQKSAGAAN